MKSDFGFFGSGLEGYVQYNEAFKRNFDSTSIRDDIPEDEVLDMEPEEDRPTADDLDQSLEDEDPIDNGEF